MPHSTHRPQRIALLILLASYLGLVGASYAAAQPPPFWADLLTPTTAASHGSATDSPWADQDLQVEVHSKALTRGTPQLHIQTLDGRSYQAHLDHLSWDDHGVITWAGHISALGQSCPVLLSADDGRVVGVIETPKGRYELVPTPSGHLLKRFDASRFGSCAPAKDHVAAALR